MSLRNIILLMTLGILSTATLANSSAEEKIKELEARLEALEYKSYESIATLNGSVKHTSVFFNLKDNAANTTDKYKRFKKHVISSKIDLNARPSDDVFLNTRLSMKKFWYNQAYESSDSKYYADKLTFGESRQGVTPSDSTVYMERVFIQWSFVPTWTLTIGRLPLSGGSPKGIMEGAPEDAPFHKFTMSEVNDGASLSKKHNLTNGDSLKFTLAYLPWGTFNVDTGSRITDSSYKDKSTDNQGVAVDTSDPIYIFITDYKTRNFSWVREFNFSFQYAKWFDVFLGPPASSNLRSSVDRHTWTFDLLGIVGSKFDLNFAYTHSETESSGAFAGGGLFCSQTATETCKVKGDAFMAIANYRATDKWGFGYLFLKNSSHNLLFDNDMDLGYILFMSPGGVNHIGYTNYRFNTYLTGALSLTMAKIKKRYAVSNLIGTEEDVDYNIDGLKFSLTARF